MRIQVGSVAALFRYPVKSLRGEPIEAANVGWHGLDGDRRLGFRLVGDRGGFPWLTASRLPELILFTPLRRETHVDGSLPTHVRTPEGAELGIFSEELATEVGRRHGHPVEMMHMNRGIFDEASISIITSCTVAEIGTAASHRPDARRFRPNIVISSLRSAPFEEDQWVGGVLSFGDTGESTTVGITNRDERCAMVNLDPDSARRDGEVLKTIVRRWDNRAGVYGTTTRCGPLAIGQPVFFTD